MRKRNFKKSEIHVSYIINTAIIYTIISDFKKSEIDVSYILVGNCKHRLILLFDYDKDNIYTWPVDNCLIITLQKMGSLNSGRNNL